MSAMHDLLDRSAEAHYLARAVDDEHHGHAAHEAVNAIDAAWGAAEATAWGPTDLGLDEDDADTLGLAVFAAYVTVVETAVELAWLEYCDADPAPSRSWGSSPWSAEAFPKAALGLH